MKPVTKTLLVNLLRLGKGMIVECEKWVNAQEMPVDKPP